MGPKDNHQSSYQSEAERNFIVEEEAGHACNWRDVKTGSQAKEYRQTTETRKGKERGPH